ncbi:hypothetical protein [uncultured Pseudomonas sp.]|uniref:hypothetical protein n=1 Tax=uncultured Pseudomonas sp. TaxID=114707 RepID=UPI0025E6ABEC|nr:hypothetical protein [uncultured Pseudomonas sp.]
MTNSIYVVQLKRGRSHPEYPQFFENVTDLRALGPDHGGINNICLLSHAGDEEEVRLCCASGLEDPAAVTVQEVTKTTLDPEKGIHKRYADLIGRRFLPYGRYPIGRLPWPIEDLPRGPTGRH